MSLERWRPLRARGIDIDFPFFLAPMVGLSHVALRRMVSGYAPAGTTSLSFTEMLSSRRLPSERMGDRPETATAAEERNLVPQLVGNEERFLAASLRKLEALRPSGVDINMGCPVTHAFRHNWGVALMGDPARAEQVVRSSVARSPWPISVKMRSGLHDDPAHLVDFARMLEAAGAAWITLHPRLAVQHRRGKADWENIARVRDAVSIPVIGNGDVQTAEDAFALLRATGCDGVMIGRAALARPWIFWQIGEKLGLGPPSGRDHEKAPADGFSEGQEFHRALAHFIDEAEARFSYADARKRLNFFVQWGGRWLDYGHELARRLGSAPDLETMRTRASDFFEKPQRMSQRTDLRA